MVNIAPEDVAIFMSVVTIPFELFFGSIVIKFYIKYKSFRKKPGDLFVMLAVFDIILGCLHTLHLLTIFWGKFNS